MEAIKKVLANAPQDLTEAEKAQARANIGAGQGLVAGANVYITGSVISSVVLSSHVANLVLDHEEDTYHAYKVTGCVNNAINHVIVNNHSADICDIWVEAPTLRAGEEFFYIVEFNCTNSTGTCAVDVQSARPVEIEDYSLGTDPDTGDPVLQYQWITNPYVSFNTTPTYQVRVIGNSFEIKKF